MYVVIEINHVQNICGNPKLTITSLLKDLEGFKVDFWRVRFSQKNGKLNKINTKKELCVLTIR